MKGKRCSRLFTDEYRRNHIYILTAIILTALLLRTWGIWNAEHTDEYNEVFEALRVCSGHLNYSRWLKRLFLYILAFEYGIYYLVGWIFNVFSSPMDFASQIVRDMTPLFFIGRLTNALLGSASVVLLYQIGKRVSGPACGLVAALFFAFTGVHIVSSHLVNVDVPMCFLLLLSLLFIVRVYQLGGQTKDYILASLFAGLAIQAKLPAVVILAPFFLSHIFLYYKEREGVSIKFIDKKVILAAVFLILGFILGNPAVVIKPLAFVKSGMGMSTLREGSSVYDFEINGWLFYLRSLIRDMGLGVFVLSLFGIVLTVIKEKKEYLILLSFILFYYPLMASENKLVFSRYMIPLIPFLDLMAAGFLLWLASKFRSLRSTWAIPAIALILVSFTFYPILRYELSLTGQNTRYVARDWIEQNIPKDSKILLQTGRSINSDAPPIAESRQNLEEKINRINKYLQSTPGTFDVCGIVDKNAMVFYDLMLKNVPEITYNITSTEFYRNIKDYRYYVQNGYQYAIIKSDSQDFYRSPKRKMSNPKLFNFYDQLARHAKLIKEFKPDTYHRGERFRIYAFQ